MSHVRLLVICVLFLALLTVAAIVLSVIALTRENEVEKRDVTYPRYPSYPSYPRPDYPRPNPRPDPKQPDPWPPAGWPTKGDEVVVNNYIGGGCCDDDRKGGRVWIIAAGDEWGTFNRFDKNMKINGWSKAVVVAACRAAGIRCKVIYAPDSDCIDNRNRPFGWQQHLRLGQGLARGQFDACSGWFPTFERRDVGIFSDGYLAQDYYSLWYRSSNTDIDPGDAVEDETQIAFIAGPPGDEICMRRFFNRIGQTFNGIFIGEYDGTASAFDGLATGGAGGPKRTLWQTRRDLILSEATNLAERTVFDSDDSNVNPSDQTDTGDIMLCSQGPAGLLARKDRWELIELFNIGLRYIFDNGEYAAICENAVYNTLMPTSEHKTWCVDV